ncbi:helix-turn-helix transcriptional regulator [Bacillus horti]|uniref:DNA-binding transcriptional regulator YafY n=1 Tax=Caldalkalibacillus horti TaxID=77523 RepID=A0ABT9VWX5_9BACI|nr:WYL domain-containing protein [Bacillus horti]MDQ0165317.1 putative DNA-binding transcriptional regulator YafY [Bacillus horti]
MVKLDYLLSVLWILKTNPKTTAAQIAEQLEISVRTVYRYIDILCTSGVPIIAEPGHGGGFKLPESFVSLPLFFETMELKAIGHSALLARQAEYPYADSLDSALQKITHRLNDSQREELQRQSNGLQIVEQSRSLSLQSVLRQLEKSVLENATLFIHYAKSKRNIPIERKVDPYGLVFHLNKWYLVAYCHIRQQERVFRVDRISDLSYSGGTFDKPSIISIQDLFHCIHVKKEPKGNSVTVCLVGSEEILDQFCNHWFLQAHLSKRSDNKAEFALEDEAMKKYFPPLLLSFGKSVQVLKPSSLNEIMSTLAYDLAKFYEAPELR